jgi:ribose 5-phosphate isomerase
MTDVEVLRTALKATVKQLNNITPLLQCGDDGTGPDCTEHFQVILDANFALDKTAKSAN